MNPSFNVNDTLPYALVAGGSKGIGYAIAGALARRHYNLILVARDYSALSAAKENLEATYRVRVEIMSHDLSREESTGEIAQWCIDRDIKIKILCNAGGLGGEKDYLSLPLDSLRCMVNVNLESCMAMSLLLLPLLEKNAPSYILNVSSLAGFAPIPSKNIYSATKAAVMYFSYALRFQLAKKKYKCELPGTRSGFYQTRYRIGYNEQNGMVRNTDGRTARRNRRDSRKKDIRKENDNRTWNAGENFRSDNQYTSQEMDDRYL